MTIIEKKEDLYYFDADPGEWGFDDAVKYYESFGFIQRPDLHPDIDSPYVGIHDSDNDHKIVLASRNHRTSVYPLEEIKKLIVL